MLAIIIFLAIMAAGVVAVAWGELYLAAALFFMAMVYGLIQLAKKKLGQ